MNSNYFFSLSQDIQEQYLYYYGEIIAEIEEKEYYTSLFLLNNFYAEAFVCKDTSHIMNIIQQEDPQVHLLYLDKLQIDISSLQNNRH